jgi:hypothetical protein
MLAEKNGTKNDDLIHLLEGIAKKNKELIQYCKRLKENYYEI